MRTFARDSIASLLLQLGLTNPKIIGRHSLSIVTFHRVLTDQQLADYPMPELALNQNEFGRFLDIFNEHYRCGTLSESLEQFRSHDTHTRPLLAITFDDGQLDNYENARHQLEARGLRATFFPTISGATTGRALWHDEAAFAIKAIQEHSPRDAADFEKSLGVETNGIKASPSLIVSALKQSSPETRTDFIAQLHQCLGDDGRPEWDGMMNADQLRLLARNGHEIGSHSYSHPILNQCTHRELQREVVESKAILESIAGTTVTAFCYPNGDYNTQVKDVVRDAGYEAAVTTRFGRNGKKRNALELRRFDIQRSTSMDRFGAFSRARLALRLSGLQPGL